MTVETAKMSSKGQIVIPQEVRKRLHAEEGSIFVIISNKDSIILKKLKTPSKEELIIEFKKIAAEGRKRADILGIKESDIPEIIHKIRREKQR